MQSDSPTDALVNNPTMQPVLRAMCAADDDRVGMSAVAHMLEAAEREGWVLVPKEPTPEMLAAAERADDEAIERGEPGPMEWPAEAHEHWRVMIAARPSKSNDGSVK